MKKKKLLIFLLAVVATLSVVLAACAKYTPGSEVGVYYYDSADGEYTLTLSDTAQFELVIKGQKLQGNFKLENDKLSLEVKNKGVDDIAATYRNDEITLNYNQQTMKFIRKINYTVSFVSNGGSAVNSQNVVNGRTVVKPSDPTRNSYSFVGWYQDELLTTPYDFSTPVTGNITLYAKWREVSDGRVEHTVTFDGNYSGASKVAVTTVNSKVLDMPSAPTQAGHVFVGWFVSNYNDGAKLTYKFDATAEVYEDMVVYAAWSSASHTDLGVSVTDKQITWNVTSGVNSYTVTVKNQAGDVVKSDFVMTTTYNGIDFATMPADDYVVEVNGTGMTSPTVRYFRNKGLDKVSGFKVESGTLLVFNPVENAEKYLITIYCGNEDHNHVLLDNGNSTNYNFVNCEMTSEGITFVVTAVADGYLSSVSDTYTVVKNLDGASEVTYSSASETVSWNAVENADYYVVTFVRDGNVVYETYADSTSVSVIGLDKGQYDVSLVAMAWGYNSSVANYTFTKDTDATAGVSLTYSNGRVSWAPVAGVDEYVVKLNGNTIAQTSGNSVAISFDRSGNNEISVQCGLSDNFNVLTITVYVYEVAFDVRGGNTIDGDTIYVAQGDEINYPVQTSMIRNGYDFKGWYTIPNGADENGRRVADKYFSGDSDVVLYAYWKVAGVYLTYNYGQYSDGSVSDTQCIVYPNSHYTLVVPTSRDETVAFVGWYTDENGNGTRLTDENGASLAPWTGTEDITVYAYWAQIFSYVAHGADYGVTKGPGINYVSNVKVPATYNGGNVTVIEGMAFSNCLNVVSISIPDSVTLIEATAFEGCTKLLNVYVYETGVKEVVYFDIDGVVFKSDGVNSLAYFPLGRTGSYTLPDGITQIPARSFAGCQLSEIVLTDDVSYVGMYAFYNCTKLVNIVLGNNSALEIEDYAFSNCNALTSITIPDGVTFALNIFDGCSSLSSINANNSEYQSANGMLVTDTTLVYAPKGISGTVSIPAGITSIGSNAFSDCNKLAGIVIPGFVTEIGSGAFSNCSALASVTINGSKGNITIAEYAFANSSNLTTVTVNNVTVTMGAYAFANCSRLYKVEFVNCATSEIADHAFYKDSNLTEVKLPNVEVIGAYAFADCISLASITLPISVTVIGDHAFSGCSMLANVYFGAGESQGLVVGERAFEGTVKLATIELPNGTSTIEQYAFSASGLEQIVLPNSIDTVGAYAFTNSVSLAYVRLSDSLESLGYRVFYGCSSLIKVGLGRSYQFNVSDFDGAPVAEFEFVDGADYSAKDGLLYNADQTVLLGTFGTNESVEIVATVTTIEADAFSNSQVKHVTFAENSVITEIGDWAFAYATALETVVLPDSVTIIVQHAFFGCTSLTSINLGNVTKIGSQAFMGASSLQEIDISRVTSASNIGSQAFVGTTSLQRVTLSDDLTALPYEAFYGCVSLSAINLDNITSFGDRSLKDTAIAQVTFANDLSYIGTNAFDGTKITSVDLSNTKLQSIGVFAFSNCSELVSVTLNDSINVIDTGVFSGCNKLKDVNLSNVYRVDSSAFSGCASFTQVDLTNVTYIGSSAFRGCSQLKTVTLADALDTLYIGSYAFEGCSLLESFVFPDIGDEFEIENGTFRNCTSLVSIKLPANLTAIGEGAFEGCTSLQSVDFSLCMRTLEDIYERAFAGCTSLQVVDLLADSGCKISSLGEYAFSNCTSLETVKLPHSLKSFDASIFDGCSSLKEIVVSQSNKNFFVDNGVLFNSNSLLLYPQGKTDAEYTIPTKVNNKTITTVLSGAFAENTHLTRVTIPAGISTIKQYAFLNCTELMTVVFDEDCTTTCENGAFSGCNALVEIVFGTNARPNVGNMFTGSQITEITIPKEWTKLSSGMFANMTKLTKVTVEEGSQLTELPYGLFAGCTSLTEIDLSNCSLVTTMDRQLFLGCTSLQTITLPLNITNIDNLAFGDCESLVEIYIPASVREIDSTAFNGCVSLTIIRIDPSNPYYEYDNGALYNKGKTVLLTYLAFNTATSFNVPVSVTEIANSAFLNNTTLQSVTLPSNLMTIQNSAFKGSSIVSINIPSSVVEIKSSAFENCQSLTDLTFEKGGTAILTISSYVFQNCTALTDITLPARLRTKYDPSSQTVSYMYTVGIGASAFEGCTGLVTVNFETDDNLTYTDNMKYLTLDRRAFFGCTSLKSVTLPDYVASYIPSNSSYHYYGNAIGENCFNGCTSLSEFNILTDAQFTIALSAFRDCTSLKELTLPSSLYWVGSNVFYGWTEEQTIYMGVQQSQSGSWGDLSGPWNNRCNANVVWKA